MYDNYRQQMPSVDLSRFAPIDEMELTRVHRPTVIHLGGSNGPTNCLTCGISTCASPTTIFGSQPAPEDQEAVDPRADRRPVAATQCPGVATNLLAAYKYPLTLHYK